MMDTPVSVENQLKITKRQLEQLEQEKKQLSDQFKEVTRMNKRWQRYSQQQDVAKGELTQTNTDLNNKNKVSYNLLVIQNEYCPFAKKIAFPFRRNEL